MSNETAPTPNLIPYFMPSLGSLLVHAEKLKGAPLTEPEVIAIRDDGVCVMLPLDKAHAMDESRGYRDLDPANVWEEFLALKRALADSPMAPAEPEPTEPNP